MDIDTRFVMNMMHKCKIQAHSNAHSNVPWNVSTQIQATCNVLGGNRTHHHYNKSIRRRLRPNVSPWITSPKQMLDKSGFACRILAQKHHLGLGIEVTLCLHQKITAHVSQQPITNTA